MDIHVYGRDAYFYDEPEKETAFFHGHGETTILAALYYNLSKDEFLPAIRRVRAFMRSKQTCALAGFYIKSVDYAITEKIRQTYKNEQASNVLPIKETASDIDV